MRPDDMLEHIRRRPFEPFRICMSDGRSYEVLHPDQCMVGRTTAYVGVPERSRKELVMRVDHCALVHIVRFEPLNGSHGRSLKKKTR